MDTKRFLTEVEAADWLGVSISLLRKFRYGKVDDGPAVTRIGHAVRYDVIDLEAYVRSRKVAS